MSEKIAPKTKHEIPQNSRAKTALSKKNTTKSSPAAAKNLSIVQQKANQAQSTREKRARQKPLNFKILRQKGISLFRKKLYDQAKIAFCLAYEQNPNNELLSFIELCTLAKHDQNGVSGLFELYCANISKNQEKNLTLIIDILQKTTYAQSAQSSQDSSISYEDFCDIVRANGDFGSTFQRVIHSTRIVISNKKSLVDFISRLIDSGFTDLAIHYMETTHTYLTNELDALAQKLKSKDDF